MTHTDPVTENVPSKHPPLRDTPLRLALRDARTAAMIARAYLSGTLRYDEPITPDDVRLLEEAIQMLQHMQRMLDLHDPYTD